LSRLPTHHDQTTRRASGLNQRP